MCTRRPTGTPTSICATCLLGADADPQPPPDESPEARWCWWDEAMGMADPGLIDALPLARAAYEAMA